MNTALKYRNQSRPDEAGMVFLCDQSQAEEMKVHLMRRGFIIVDDFADDDAAASDFSTG